MNGRSLSYIIVALLTISSPAHSAYYESPLDDLESLIPQADLIIIGHVKKISQDLRNTRVHVMIDEVLKGDTSAKELIVEHRGGKHTVVDGEPEFTSYDKSLLYLTRSGYTYRCVDGAQGKKLIRNENIYLHPDNIFVTMHLDKYKKAVTERIESTSNQLKVVSDKL